MQRFGIPSARAFGVSSAIMRPMIKRLGRDHDLALALWETGWLEARMLAGFVAEPQRVTPALMDRWCRGFDNWAICDSTCIHLFSRSPNAWRKAAIWSRRQDEFVKRAGFALLAALAVHDKRRSDQPFIDGLVWVEAAAGDHRNFVKKAVNWALRQIGKRNPSLNAQSIAVARRLAAAPEPVPRWIGKDALRELTSDGVRTRLAARERRQRAGARRPVSSH